MDEPFHVPQAQRYCDNNFEWDPKITTPPALYYLSLILAPLIGCSIFSLRFTNVLLGFWKYYLLAKLVPSPGWLYVLPIPFFYHHLYYTDTLSEVLMLQSYYGVISGSRLHLFIFGFASVFVRQTNVVLLVWMVFWGIYERNKHKHPLLLSSVNKLTISEGCEVLGIYLRIIFSNGLLDMGILLCMISYLIHLMFNYGLVQGDVNNHQLSLHFPQLLYFGITIFGIFALFSPIKYRLVPFAMLWCIIFIILHYFTIHHPFLLSDNRHLTFYFWKLFYRNLTVYKELIYSFVYSVAWYAIFKRLGQFPLIPVCGFLGSLCLVLIPLPLFEFRYFIFHATIFGICFSTPSRMSRTIIVGLNIFVITLFLLHPAHIMW